MENSKTFAFDVVSSSSGEVYKVTVKRTGANLTCKCTCAAAQISTHCKHRLRILSGSADGVISSNLDEVKQVAKLCVGTDVEKALIRISEIEGQQALLKRELASAKKALARTLDD